MPAPVEGAVQYRLTHETRALHGPAVADAVATLTAWREVLARLGVLGQDPERYDGLAYGNASARLGPFGDVGRGARRFLITGGRTSGLRAIGLAHVAVVERWDLDANALASAGLTPPSSEALTHAALYDVAPAIRFVFHAHCPEIWRSAARLGIPATRPNASNGTVGMAREVQRLWRESALASLGILAMGGHEDGVLTLGATADTAGVAMVRHLARALERSGA
jgi:hypothetical protein